MREVTVYESMNGKQFKTEEKCAEYEKELLWAASYFNDRVRELRDLGRPNAKNEILVLVDGYVKEVREDLDRQIRTASQ